MEGVSALLTHILGVGGQENFDILQVGGPENFVILRVGGFIRPPRMIAYSGNCVGGWSEQNCDSGGGWSEKKIADTPPLTFLME